MRSQNDPHNDTSPVDAQDICEALSLALGIAASAAARMGGVTPAGWTAFGVAAIAALMYAYGCEWLYG